MILAHHLLLDYVLICGHFGRFLDEFDYGVCVYNSFERVNLWYRCVYCYQSGEVRWRVTDDILGVTLWRSLNTSVWRFGRVRRRRSWCTWMFVGDRSIVEWCVGSADDQIAACLSVSPYRRLLRSSSLCAGTRTEVPTWENPTWRHNDVILWVSK